MRKTESRFFWKRRDYQSRVHHLRWGLEKEGRADSLVLALGWSHRQVPGQCGGGDTQSRCPRLSRPTDFRRACSSVDAAEILGVRVCISFSSSFMRDSTSWRLRAPREWRLVGEGECQRRLRDGRRGLEEGEFCGAGGTSIRCNTTRGSDVGRGTVWTRWDEGGFDVFLDPRGAGHGPWVISLGGGNPWSNRA